MNHEGLPGRGVVDVGDGHRFRMLHVGCLPWRGLPPWTGIATACGTVRAGRCVVDAGSRFLASVPAPLACYAESTPPPRRRRGPGGLHMKADDRSVPMTPNEFFKRFARRQGNALIVEKAAVDAQLVIDGGVCTVEAVSVRPATPEDLEAAPSRIVVGRFPVVTKDVLDDADDEHQRRMALRSGSPAARRCDLDD